MITAWRAVRGFAADIGEFPFVCLVVAAVLILQGLQ